MLENLVAVELTRRYGTESVSFYRKGHEIDFVVEPCKRAVQVAYSIASSETREREVTPLLKFAQTHPDWQMLLLTHEEEATITIGNATITVVPAWRWLLENAH